MNIADIGLLVLVYIYVIAIFVFSEKFLKDLPSFSRRFVHIMVGNCIFVMPFFNDPYAMGVVFNTSNYNSCIFID